MKDDVRADALKRLSSIEGHLAGIRKMIEDERYCVDILKQSFAVRRALEKMEAVMLDGHLHSCVVDGIESERREETLSELLELYQLANR